MKQNWSQIKIYLKYPKDHMIKMTTKNQQHQILPKNIAYQ